MNLFRRKSVTALQIEATTDNSLKRALGALNLTALGIGAIIGTGIFVLTGTVAALNAGPAVVSLRRSSNGYAKAGAAGCSSRLAPIIQQRARFMIRRAFASSVATSCCAARAPE